MSMGDEMRLRPLAERHGAGGGGPAGGEGSLDVLRAEGERLLAAADEVIDRVLSGDTEAFLRASRQHGGQ